MTTKKASAKKSTRRRKTAAIPRVRPPQVGPVDVEGAVHFSPYDLARYEAAQGRVANAAQAVLLQRATIEARKREHQEWLRTAQDELVRLASDVNEKQGAMRALQAEMEVLYGLDFASVTYDDNTGRLFTNGETVPASALAETSEE